MSIRIDATSSIVIQDSQKLETSSEKQRSSSGELGASKSLEIAIKDFIEKMPADGKSLPVLSAMLQSMHESMSRIAENMTLTREELRELEERRARVEKIEKLAEQKKLDETEALRELELLLSAEDRKLLDEQYAMQANKYA